MSAFGQSTFERRSGTAMPDPNFHSSKQTFQNSKFRRESDCEGTNMRPSDKSAGNSSEKNTGNFSAENGRPRAFRITQRDWRMLSSGAFREHVGDRSGAAKALADEVECSPKTAQSWLDGESTPAGILDLRAMATIPAYAALKREIAALQADMDPRLQAKILELHRMALSLAGEP